MNPRNKLPGRPSQDRFAKMVIDSIRQIGEKGKIIYDREGFCLHGEGETERRLRLGELYRRFCGASEEMRAEFLRAFAQHWSASKKATPVEYEDAKSDLLPVVDARSHYENAGLRDEEGAIWPHQIIGEDLAVSVAYDLPEALRLITVDDMERWGLTFYEALEVARENLYQLPQEFVGPEEGEGVYVSVNYDSYDASRLLLLDMIRQMRVKGDFVAMVPNRDTLIVTGSDDEQGLRAMWALAKEAWEDRPLSTIAVRLDGDEWVSWMPDAAHPLYQEFRILRIQSFGLDYSEQKELLDRLHAKKNQDIVTAPYMAMQVNETGHFVSYCDWTKNVLSLLPRTDLIAFVPPDGKGRLMAQWDRVVEVMGDSMEPLDIHPQRFRVREFPTDEQLAAMGAKTP